jgi:ubiquinone/menaquinone biosynthesis C-methylase UbiE
VAYDRVADGYRQWHWYGFWRINEAPIVGDWLRTLPRGRGLDAGSGTGPYLRAIVALGHRCMAVDASLEMLKRSDGLAANGPAGACACRVQADIRALPLANEEVEWILCTRTLSHVPDLDAAIRELARVLKPGAECFITDVHPDHPYEYVRIPHRGTQVTVETHKHPLEQLHAVSASNGFHVAGLAEHRLAALVHPPSRTDFGKLYLQPDRPIFYVCRLVKTPHPTLRPHSDPACH